MMEESDEFTQIGSYFYFIIGCNAMCDGEYRGAKIIIFHDPYSYVVLMFRFVLFVFHNVGSRLP